MINTYFPFIGTGPEPTFGNAAALAFYRLLVTDPRQCRTRLDPCPALTAAAQHRAAMLATMPDLAHIEPDGVTTVNEVARRFGCGLPAHYAARGNGIESLVAGTSDAQAAFEALARSLKHAAHLFGESDFYREQTQIGIALVEAPSSRWRWYWSILIGQCGVRSGE